MSDLDEPELDEQARAILRENDRGGYTVPTARLYPFQWNWDSAFCALGFATFDIDRAFREVETLVEGQWRGDRNGSANDGMIPHIVFRRPDPDYFPGPDAWGTHGLHPPGMPTSGISQPPVLGSVLPVLAVQNPERAKPLIEATLRWHAWWHRARCDEVDDGVVSTIVHPWESGRDNCPDWDAALDRIVVPDDLPAYTRRDTSHIDADQRPHRAQYDRYMTIVKFGRDHGWSPDAFRNGPFRVADPGCHFILMRAERDLAALCMTLGIDGADEALERYRRLRAGCDHLWSREAGGFVARDRANGAMSAAASSASMLCWYGGAGTTLQRERSLQTLRAMLKVEHALPSWHPDDETFEAVRYWRGPVWAVVNRMVALGLADEGHADLAARIQRDTRRLIEGAGFFEYFDPVTGRGLGGDRFSWTAAMWLHWAREETS